MSNPNPNITGNNNVGSCLTTIPPSSSCKKYTGINKSQYQCNGQFNGCPQKYPFPLYYYDAYLSRVENMNNISPDNLKKKAIELATQRCNKIKARSWKSMGSPTSLTIDQIGSIYKNAYPPPSPYSGFCPHAIIVSSGEAQILKNATLNSPATFSYQMLWGIGFDPDKEASQLTVGKHFQNCINESSIIKNGFISSGNENKIGPFCHTNPYGGVEWGGGMCSGFCGKTPPPSNQSCLWYQKKNSNNICEDPCCINNSTVSQQSSNLSQISNLTHNSLFILLLIIVIIFLISLTISIYLFNKNKYEIFKNKKLVLILSLLLLIICILSVVIYIKTKNTYSNKPGNVQIYNPNTKKYENVPCNKCNSSGKPIPKVPPVIPSKPPTCNTMNTGPALEAGHGGKWEDAYFTSSGTKGPYTNNDIGKLNTSNNLDGGYPNGADPSCGSKDTTTWTACGLNPSSNNYSTTNNYNITNINAYKQAFKNSGANTCINCNNSNGTNDCNGHIILTDSSNKGKVAVLAHGSFGALPSIWYNNNNQPMAVCSTGHYSCNYDKFSYGKLVSLFNYIVQHGIDDTGLSNYVKLYTPTSSILITKQAFIDAGLSQVWNNLGTVSNNGVALSWGHGFFTNGCGDMTFVKQGNKIKSTKQTSSNNVSLNLQIGTRSWSGELTDSITTSKSVSKQGQAYIVEGLPNASNSASCLQPLIMPFNYKDANKLFEFLCSKSSSFCTIASSGNCKYVGSNTYPSVISQCTSINNKTLCDQVSSNWNCAWK